MDNIISVVLDEKTVCPHELVVAAEVRPDFLPRATLVHSEGRRALLYSREGLIPFARFGAGPGIVRLGSLFVLLTGYIRTLLAARDMLLDTSLLSSDTENGVFVPGASVNSESGPESASVKAIWGVDAVKGEGEKICRVAASLAGHERVMGAKTSMERMINIVRSENPSLLNCLKAAERLCREWNHITLSHSPR